MKHRHDADSRREVDRRSPTVRGGDADRRSPAVRRYSEKEVGRLLRRATELQRSEPSLPDPGGFTLGELEEVALEAGIDPRYLRKAAAELEAGAGEGLAEKLTGAPIGFVLERTVPGELPESRFEALVPLLSAGTIGQGNASAVGKTLTWSSRSDSNTSSQQVLVQARDGETLVRVEERLGGFAGGLFGGLMGGVGGGVGIGVGGAVGGVLGLPLFAVAFPVTVIAGTYVAAREIFKAHVRRRRRHMQELLDRIVEQVAREATESLPRGEGQGV